MTYKLLVNEGETNTDRSGVPNKVITSSVMKWSSEQGYNFICDEICHYPTTDITFLGTVNGILELLMITPALKSMWIQP